MDLNGTTLDDATAFGDVNKSWFIRGPVSGDRWTFGTVLQRQNIDDDDRLMVLRDDGSTIDAVILHWGKEHSTRSRPGETVHAWARNRWVPVE